MSEQFDVEPLGDHEYLVRAHLREEVIESRFQASPAVLDELRLPKADEQRVVREAALFLAERQPVIDFPQMVDLDDLIAVYDDFLDPWS
ncbi:hypothetical protein OH809_39740 [Streptomyces sp. NBC_00873]|uniref:hypothetical protein n=1 Tax=unclassified Streptomyces TaxID=2593676 RepID=UPI00386F7A39|nr:hypothetical protein OH809_39740 [Streptomyces sp. NBC_00873]WTA41903.1 hypothetical protein OH821_03955 [Streptomyces sp. NBC_00842]